MLMEEKGFIVEIWENGIYIYEYFENYMLSYYIKKEEIKKSLDLLTLCDKIILHINNKFKNFDYPKKIKGVGL